MNTVDIYGWLGPDGEDNGSGTRELRTLEEVILVSALASDILKTDKQTNQSKQQQKQQTKQKGMWSSELKSCLLFEQLLKYPTLTVALLQCLSVQCWVGRRLRGQRVPVGDSSLTYTREKGYCIRAQDFCFCFIVNSEAKGKEI